MNAAPRRAWPLAVAAGLAFLVLMGLGLWQLERRSEKHAFIAALQAAASQPPAPFPGRDRWSSEDEAFRRVRASGVFVSGATRFVHTTVAAGNETAVGFYVLTPLALDAGGTVFVNRGTVPAGPAFRPPALSTPEGPRSLTGFLRPPERASLFLPNDDPARGDWFRRDPDALKVGLGLPDVAPFVLDEERSAAASGPQGLDPEALIAAIPDNHLQYALTWFGLASALAGVYVALVRAPRADKGGPAALGSAGRDI